MAPFYQFNTILGLAYNFFFVGTAKKNILYDSSTIYSMFRSKSSSACISAAPPAALGIGLLVPILLAAAAGGAAATAGGGPLVFLLVVLFLLLHRASEIYSQHSSLWSTE